MGTCPKALVKKKKTKHDSYESAEPTSPKSHEWCGKLF